MKKSLNVLIIFALTLFTIFLVGCGKKSETVQETPQQGNTTENTAAMTKEEYEGYLTERYNHYFNNENVVAQYDVYNIYNDSFNYEGTYDEFVTGYNKFYTTDRANLEALKNDLAANVRKGNAEVDKFNDEVMTALDKAIIASDEYGASFAEKTKDYGTLAKDEVVKGLRDIGRVSHEARVEFSQLVANAKEKLGIK